MEKYKYTLLRYDVQFSLFENDNGKYYYKYWELLYNNEHFYFYRIQIVKDIFYENYIEELYTFDEIEIHISELLNQFKPYIEIPFIIILEKCQQYLLKIKRNNKIKEIIE